jgi:hypothetical protein
LFVFQKVADRAIPIGFSFARSGEDRIGQAQVDHAPPAWRPRRRHVPDVIE